MAASNSDSDFESPPVRSSSKKSSVGNLSWTRKKQLARKKTKLPPRIAKTSMNADVSSSLVSWFIFNKYFKSVNVICLCYLFHNHFWLIVFFVYLNACWFLFISFTYVFFSFIVVLILVSVEFNGKWFCYFVFWVLFYLFVCLLGKITLFAVWLHFAFFPFWLVFAVSGFVFFFLGFAVSWFK